MNLIEGLQAELKRNRELKALYDTIPTGGFGSAMIALDISNGEQSIALGDTVLMLKAYKALKDNE